MPTWTTDNERRLFLTIIEVTGVKTSDWGAVAEKMGPGYTRESVRQHFMKIKKQTGNAPSPTKATPKTPTKNGTPGKNSTPAKTSNSKPSKRKQATVADENKDDDDDNLEERKPTIDLTNGNITPNKRIKTEDNPPKRVFKSESVGVEGQIDLDADAESVLHVYLLRGVRCANQAIQSI
ncbi:MAG: hypothetical protein M1836_003048 [Candelina mexicana]|nr:MAG: hypothetical protein M1836_003048 [Candelina mexicana]